MASVYSSAGVLQISLVVFSVKSWSEREVSAFKSDGCIGLSLVIREAENLALLRREVYEKCKRNPVWSTAEFTLGDGSSE